MSTFPIYLGLFSASFLASTLLPAQSEAVLVGLLLTQKYDPWILVLVASLGNVLGSVVNWILGYNIQKLKHKRWFPVRNDSLARATNWYRRYGRWTLLLSWIPIIGDPITFVAGVMRERISVFLAIVTLAKTGRYLILAAITLKWLGT